MDIRIMEYCLAVTREPFRVNLDSFRINFIIRFLYKADGYFSARRKQNLRYDYYIIRSRPNLPDFLVSVSYKTRSVPSELSGQRILNEMA